jgi:integrase
MARVERLPSGKYRIRWTDPWGRRTSRTFSTAADARAWQRKIHGDLARGEYVDPRRGRTTLEAWADDWLLGARNLGQGGRDIYRQALDRIIPVLGKLPIGKVTAADVDRYIDLRLGTHAASTVHRDYRTLHRLFAVAVERGMVPRNPCEHVQPPKLPRAQVTVLTVDQVDALANAITPRYRAVIYVAAYGGLRWSELVGLRRRYVEGPVVRVVEQLVRRRDGTWDRCEPKVGSRRTVTLPGFAAAELAHHLDTYSLPGDDGLVFPTGRGTPMQGPSWSSNTFRRAFDRAGLPRIRVHDLRHTSVSLALDAGARLEVVQERHGHSSVRVTADIYGHNYAGADETVAAALDELHSRAQRARLRVV